MYVVQLTSVPSSTAIELLQPIQLYLVCFVCFEFHIFSHLLGRKHTRVNIWTFSHTTTYHPFAHKPAVPRTLFKWAQWLCSNPVDRVMKRNFRKQPHKVHSPDLFPLWTNQKDLGPTKHEDMFLSHWSLRNILALEEWFTLFPATTALSPIVGQIGRTFLSHCLKEHKQALRSANSVVVQHIPSAVATYEASVTDSNPQLHPRCALEPRPQNRECDRLIARTDPDTGSACTYQFPAKTLNEHLLFSPFFFYEIYYNLLYTMRAAGSL